MKKTIVVAIAALFAGSVYAAQTNNGCQGNCPDSGGTTNNITNAGGAGGQGIGYGGAGGAGGTGGSGGTGIAMGGNAVSTGGSVLGSGNSSATGGSVSGSGNSSVRSDLNQHQGQHQGQKQSSNNRNDNSNSSNNSSTNTSYGSVATTAQSTSVGGDSTTYQAARIPVATAYAPNQYPTAPCVMGASLGFQAVGFGMSAGAPIKDEVCQFLEKVRSVSQVLGQPEVAREMMAAYDATYAEALQRIADRKAGVVTKKAEVTVEAPKLALIGE
jgi:hypothetical protein